MATCEGKLLVARYSQRSNRLIMAFDHFGHLIRLRVDVVYESGQVYADYFALEPYDSQLLVLDSAAESDCPGKADEFTNCHAACPMPLSQITLPAGDSAHPIFSVSCHPMP